jgi:hypothetical protein
MAASLDGIEQLATIPEPRKAMQTSPSDKPLAAVATPEYYTVAFRYLGELLKSKLKEAILVRPRKARAGIVLNLVQPTFAVRQTRLDEKVTQVLSLVDFIEAEPKGGNYEFEDFEDIEAYVVSPFYEWIWERSDLLWVDERPRILAAAEALEYLQTLKSSASGG